MTRSTLLWLLAAAGLVVSSSAARGDGDPGDPCKWVQPPDLDPTGMDVNATWLWDESKVPPRAFHLVPSDPFLGGDSEDGHPAEDATGPSGNAVGFQPDALLARQIKVTWADGGTTAGRPVPAGRFTAEYTR
ncbi:MAG: hypothetical protein FJ276_01165 [Planctomycetes bacterium]|nr:hypothetical protein [Planctomycetota bacterium]